MQKPEAAFRLILQTEFVNRCKRNPSYSMRAFAKFLDIDQSLLSKIMRDQRRISSDNELKLRGRLGLKSSGVIQARDLNALSDDQFSVISEWQHFAILELVKTEKFKSDVTFVAKRLGLHIEEARAAVERLERLNLLSVKGKTWKVTSEGNSWSSLKSTSEPRRLLQKKLLEKALTAIEEIPFEDRDNGSLTVAIDRKRLPEFKERLRQMRLELGTFFQEDPGFNEVYQLTVSFFPLTQQKGNKS